MSVSKEVETVDEYAEREFGSRRGLAEFLGVSHQAVVNWHQGYVVVEGSLYLLRRDLSVAATGTDK